MRLPLSAAALRIARRLRIQVPKPTADPEPKRERSAAAKLAAKLAAKRRGRRATPAATVQPKPELGVAPQKTDATIVGEPPTEGVDDHIPGSLLLPSDLSGCPRATWHTTSDLVRWT